MGVRVSAAGYRARALGPWWGQVCARSGGVRDIEPVFIASIPRRCGETAVAIEQRRSRAIAAKTRVTRREAARARAASCRALFHPWRRAPRQAACLPVGPGG